MTLEIFIFLFVFIYLYLFNENLFISVVKSLFRHSVFTGFLEIYRSFRINMTVAERKNNVETKNKKQ